MVYRHNNSASPSKTQLNSVLFAKTLVRKDVASTAASTNPIKVVQSLTSECANEAKDEKKKDDEDNFSSKVQVMTLMTTDVDRVSEFALHLGTLVGAQRLE